MEYFWKVIVSYLGEEIIHLGEQITGLIEGMIHLGDEITPHGDDISSGRHK